MEEIQKELKEMQEDIRFLTRFWVVGDYKIVHCPDEFQEEYYVYSGERVF